jgi:hypothetical protein
MRLLDAIRAINQPETLVRVCDRHGCDRELVGRQRRFCSQECRVADWKAHNPGVPVERSRPVVLRPRLSHTVLLVDGRWTVVEWRGRVVEQLLTRREARELAGRLRSSG